MKKLEVEINIVQTQLRICRNETKTKTKVPARVVCMSRSMKHGTLLWLEVSFTGFHKFRQRKVELKARVG